MTRPTQAQIEAAAMLDDLLQASVDYERSGPNGLSSARSEFQTKKAKVLAALTAAAQVGEQTVKFKDIQGPPAAGWPEDEPAAAQVGERECTCHPADNPPDPCPKQYAYTECVRAATIERCAQVAEDTLYASDGPLTARLIAAAIRKLKDAP